jgi:ribosomal protein S18
MAILKVKKKLKKKGLHNFNRPVLSFSQLFQRNRNQRPGHNQNQRPGRNRNQRPGRNQNQRPGRNRNRRPGRFPFPMEQAPMKPIIAPKSFVIILKEKPRKATYNQRIIDYKHCVLLQRYIGLGGKILRRQQTNLNSKNQRFIAKTIKSSRIAALLPFVSKEKGYFR